MCKNYNRIKSDSQIMSVKKFKVEKIDLKFMNYICLIKCRLRLP